MSYDPRYGAQNQYSTYPPQQPYPDQGQEQYNPYNNAQPHRTYEQPGYGYQDTGYGGYSDEPAAPVPPTKEKETDAYVTAAPIAPRCVGCAPQAPIILTRALVDQGGR